MVVVVVDSMIEQTSLPKGPLGEADDSRAKGDDIDEKVKNGKSKENGDSEVEHSDLTLLGAGSGPKGVVELAVSKEEGEASSSSSTVAGMVEDPTDKVRKDSAAPDVVGL